MTENGSERKAFEELERRGKISTEAEFVGDILFKMLQSDNTCTVKGVANVLAGMKHPQAYDTLMQLLLEDVSLVYVFLMLR